MQKIRAIIADDHKLIREGITSILNQSEEIEIVGQTANPCDVMGMIEEYTPDIAILDISMPEKSGLELAKEIVGAGFQTKMVILSIYDQEDYVLKSIENGCSGYLLKNAESDELISAVKTIAKGGTYYGASISKIIMESFVSRAKNKALEEETAILTRREKEIVKLIAEGISTKDLAAQLFISVRTVETHRTNIYQKLSISNTAQLVRYAVKYNLVSI